MINICIFAAKCFLKCIYIIGILIYDELLFFSLMFTSFCVKSLKWYQLRAGCKIILTVSGEVVYDNKGSKYKWYSNGMILWDLWLSSLLHRIFITPRSLLKKATFVVISLSCFVQSQTCFKIYRLQFNKLLYHRVLIVFWFDRSDDRGREIKFIFFFF